MSYAYVWEYRIDPRHRGEFEAAYGPEGPWVQLFRRAPGYVTTRLLHDREQADRYLTVDLWQSYAAFTRFRRDFADEFERLDGKCEAFTRSETALGTFESIQAP